MKDDAQNLPKQPLAEVFGYPVDNFSPQAERYRRLKLCPFHNQAVYISGTISTPFNHYISDPVKNASFDWRKHENYPRPDYLSSSRKRLASQLIYKGGILHAWRKKMAVAVDSQFFATLPAMEVVDRDDAELVWLVYDLKLDPVENRRRLTLTRTVYTRFLPALDRLTKSEPGDIGEFIYLLQAKLDEVLATGTGTGLTPDARSLRDNDLEDSIE